MSSTVDLVALTRDGRGMDRFLRVAEEIHRSDPWWVAPVRWDARKTLGPENPFWDHADAAFWVAVRDGREVGRIAAIEDRLHNEHLGERTAFFGFFESVAEVAVSGALFDQVASWARSRGLQRVLGPMNPSSNDECGLLVEGFGMRPAFMMPYNPEYYPGLVEAAGYRKAKDLLASHVEVRKTPIERIERVAGRLARRHGEVRVRPVLRRTLLADLPRIKEVYNGAWERNWGFVPMTDRELDFMASRLKPLLVEGLVWLAETETEAVGFFLAVPDFNEVLQPLRGRLLTPRLLGALPYLAGWKRPSSIRLVALGVKPAYQRHGLESAMFVEAFKAATREGFVSCEASWTLEDNVPVNRLVELFGGRRYKTYRLYERDL